LGHQGHGRHGQLLCLQTWVKGYMTEFGLVGLINWEKCLTKHAISYLSNLVFNIVTVLTSIVLEDFLCYFTCLNLIFVKILGNFQLGHHYYCLTVTGHVLATTLSNEYAKSCP
jgi:hypothetical protein